MRLLGSGGQWRFALLLTVWGAFWAKAQTPDNAAFLATLGELREASYADKATIVERLSQARHPSAGAALAALLDDRLFFRNTDQKVFLVKSSEGEQLSLIDPVSLKNAGSAPADSLTKIGTNNGLRRTLRTTVAHFALANPDASVRLDAVRDMLRSLDEGTVALLRARMGVETDARVRKEIATGLALAALGDSDPKARLAA